MILGACAENQLAREVAFPNGPQYGAMSFYVTELLKRGESSPLDSNAAFLMRNYLEI